MMVLQRVKRILDPWFPLPIWVVLFVCLRLSTIWFGEGDWLTWALMVLLYGPLLGGFAWFVWSQR